MSRVRRRARAFLGIAGILGFVVAAVGCGSGGGSSPDAPRLVILGVDGFDWEIIDPLIEQGRMPVMERLQSRGVRADLLSLVPLEKSPVIWTAIATGRLPESQGRGFLVKMGADSVQAHTSWMRRTRAFWNILPEEGVSVSVLGWLETWPAERIGGTIVSDYVQYDVSDRARRDRFGHRTYPEELFDEIEPLVTYPKDVPRESLQKLVGAPLDPDDRDAGIRQGVDDLRWIHAGDLSFTDLACEFLTNRPEDVMAIYLRGPDAVCHKFWGEREALAAAGAPSLRTRMFGEAVDRYFEETDRLIGRIVEEIDFRRTTLWIISDHGFRGGSRGPDGSIRLGVWMHRELGTSLMVGPDAVGPGVRGEGLRVIDVFPTALHLLDLPVAEDLDGEAARWILSEAGGSEREVRTVPTYETGEPPAIPEGVESPVDEQIAERVRSLGYVE